MNINESSRLDKFVATANVEIVPAFYNIKEKVPNENQDVVYVFMGRSYLGKYEKCYEPEYGKHVFYSKYGFLTDDVEYWMPINI